jgi:hypothetical protein
LIVRRFDVICEKNRSLKEYEVILHVFLRAGGVKGFSGLGKNGRMSCGGEPEYAEIFCEKQSNS